VILVLLEELTNAIRDGDSDKSKLLTEQLLEKGVKPEDVVVGGLTKGLTILGELWDKGEVFLTDVLMAINAFNAALDVVKPRLEGEISKKLGKVIIGTVAGDIHHIGKNIVATMLESSGFEVINLGEDVSTEKFCEAVAREYPDILAMSGLVSTSLPAMEAVVKDLKEKDLREKGKVMVGGPPITPEFIRKIGADLYALDGFEAAKTAKEAVGQ